MQRVVSFDSKLSYKAREFLRLKNKCIKLLTTSKIAGHKDRLKQLHSLSFEERINIMCNLAAKELIRDQIRINGHPLLSFHIHSPQLSTKINNYFLRQNL